MDVLEHIGIASMAAVSTVDAEAVGIEVGYCVFVQFVLYHLSIFIIKYPHWSSNFVCILWLLFGFALNQFPPPLKSLLAC
jgi:hypothetical protein